MYRYRFLILMEAKKKKVTIGSSIVSVLATLGLSLLEEDKISKMFYNFFSDSPRLFVILVTFLIILSIYFVLLFINEIRENKQLLGDIEKAKQNNIESLRIIKENHRIELEQEKSQAETTLNNKNEEIRNLSANFKRIISEHEVEIEKLKIEKKSLESNLTITEYQLKEKRDEVLNKEKRLKKKEKENQVLSVGLSDKNNEIEALKKQLKSNFEVDPACSWKHNVLIIDDDENIVSDLRRKLTAKVPNIHIDTLLEIPDYRLASDYEIIISDIFQCAPAEESTSILNAIKEKYPYKFVFAMSIQPAVCQGLRVDGRIIQKDSEHKFVNEFVQIVEDCRKKLDRVHEHWNEVETLLNEHESPENLIQNIKSFYYHFVKRMQIYQ